MAEELVPKREEEIEIVELDARLDMAIDPLGVIPLDNYVCGSLCGWHCTNTGCFGIGCGVSCC